MGLPVIVLFLSTKPTPSKLRGSYVKEAENIFATLITFLIELLVQDDNCIECGYFSRYATSIEETSL